MNLMQLDSHLHNQKMMHIVILVHFYSLVESKVINFAMDIKEKHHLRHI